MQADTDSQNQELRVCPQLTTIFLRLEKDHSKGNAVGMQGIRA